MVEASLDELELYLRRGMVSQDWLKKRFRKEKSELVSFLKTNEARRTPVLDAAFNRLSRAHNYETIVSYAPESPFSLFKQQPQEVWHDYHQR